MLVLSSPCQQLYVFRGQSVLSGHWSVYKSTIQNTILMKLRFPVALTSIHLINQLNGLQGQLDLQKI